MLKNRIQIIIVLLLVTSISHADINKDLILAVSRGNLAAVKELIENGAKIDTRYNKGKTPLHWACIYGNLKITAYLISKGADVNARDDDQATPLHLSAIKRNLDLVKYLILKGADINAVDKYGWTPLHYFSYYENALGVMYLIMQEADLTNTSTKEYMLIPTNYTALEIARSKNYSNIISALEDPGKYVMLSGKLFLVVSATNNIGESNVLIAPGKGFINLNIENRGEYGLSNVIVSIETLSNGEGLTLGNIPQFSIESKGQVSFAVPIEAEKNTRDGIAVLKITAKETNISRESKPFFLEIPTLSPQPPKLYAEAVIITKESNTINALETGKINVIISNRGIGFAESMRLRTEAVKNCDGIGFFEISNIILPPSAYTNLSLPIEALDNLKDGNAEFNLITEDINMTNSFTNLLSVKTKRLLKPFLTASHYIKEVSAKVIQTNIETNQIADSGDANRMEFVTNYAELTIKTIKPMILVENSGEALAKDLFFNVKFLNADDLESLMILNNFNLSNNMSFNIPEIEIGGKKLLELPVIITNTENLKMIWSISGGDEKKYSSINTNVIFEIEAGESKE